MNPLLVMLGVAVLLIAALAVVAARRGRRGRLNPPSDYYNGDPLIHSPRDVGFREGAGS
jgi:hypothetical protein